MVVAVTGGTGTLGTSVARELVGRGHEVRQLSRGRSPEVAGAVHHPIDLTTGAGLERALNGVEVVIDAANSLRRARQVLVEGTRRLAETAQAAGVRHHLLCSIVGIEHVPAAYYRVKIDQEAVVTGGQIPWSIVRATQFHALLDAIFTLTARAGVLPRPSFRLQPIDVDTVAQILADTAEATPSSRRTEIAGPQVLPVGELARSWRRWTGKRAVLVPVPLFGAPARGLRDGALTAPAAASDSPTFERWLRATKPQSRGGSG